MFKVDENYSIQAKNLLDTLVDEYKGKHHLKFMLNHQEEGYHLDLRSKKFKVNLEDSFLSHLKQIPELELKVN